MLNWNWIKRRWMDFRFGHGTYLSFVLSLTNFLLISYTFLFERIPELKTLFPNVWLFTVIFILIYLPLTSYIGYLHRKKQLSIDVELQAEINPYTLEILRRLDSIEKRMAENDA